MQFNFSETGSQSSLVKVALVLAVVVVVVEEAVFKSFLVDQSQIVEEEVVFPCENRRVPLNTLNCRNTDPKHGSMRA